ncbi:MAG: RNA polymerase sigma factor [Solirubrobacteraceae bacterium]
MSTSSMTAARGDALPAALRSDGPRREEAVRDLHALLLKAARFELSRRSAALARVRGDELEDLALQAADDAFVAVLAKLDDFRGASRFSTWAYKFALYEAAVRVRRRAWQHREVVVETERWLTVVDEHAADPQQRLDQAELLRAIRTAIDTTLTERQRTVLVALTLQGVPIDVLAERLGATRGALYKTLHDARRKLRAELGAHGYGPLP